MSGWATCVVRLMSASVTAAINAIPDERPSSPSIQLMLFIIPTIQNIVNPAASTPSKRMTPGPNGLLMTSIPMPSATANAASPICISSCQRARRSK